MHVDAMHVCENQRATLESAVFFHLYVGSRGDLGLPGSLGKHLYPPSHLAGHLVWNSQPSWGWDYKHGPLSMIRMAFSRQSHTNARMGFAGWGRHTEVGEEEVIVVCHLKSGNEISSFIKKLLADNTDGLLGLSRPPSLSRSAIPPGLHVHISETRNFSKGVGQQDLSRRPCGIFQ